MARQVLVVCLMARVGLSRTVVWIWTSHLHVVAGVCERWLRVIHGQYQTRAPHHQLIIPIRQLSVQVIRGGGASKGRTTAGVGTCGVSTDCDVAVGQVHIAVCQDEVGVVVLQLALVLLRGKRNETKTQEVTFVL